jgi:ligand-binding SRPBCC domain-containing protein
MHLPRRLAPSKIIPSSPRQELTHRFEIRGQLIEPVFALFSDPRRLNELTPWWFSLIVRGLYSPQLRPGSRIDYRLRWRGLPMAWRSVITELQPPHWLVYEQDLGPFQSFRHEHSFEPSERGIVVTDRILYKVLGGSWVDRVLVGPDLSRVLRYREKAAQKVLATPL